MNSHYDIFNTLCTIPRPSHHESKVADFLCTFADSHGLHWRRDKENCVVIENLPLRAMRTMNQWSF